MTISRPNRRSWAGAILLWVACLSGLPAFASRAVISHSEVEELHAIASALNAPASESIVVARHGLEYWAGWILHTAAAQEKSLRAETWQDFQYVYYLATKESDRLPPGPVDMRRPRSGPDHRPGPPRNISIPDDAEVLHQGPHFTLARVRQMPATDQPSHRN